MDDSTVSLSQISCHLCEGPGHRVVCRMLDMASDGSGEAIKNPCVQLLIDLDLDRKYLTAVATDYASVMKYSKNGTAKLLSDWAQGSILTRHCVLHRIYLSVVDVFV